jgi:hypothetical protein
MAKIQGGTLIWNDKEFIALATKENIRAMNKAAITVQETAKKLIGGVGSGKLYRKRKQTGKRGTFTANQWHRASKPGKPPARDTGILANSVTFEVSRKGDRIKGSVGPDVDKIRQQSPRTDPDYGFFLEIGTKDIAKRPWLKPALIKSRRKIMKLFTIVNKRLE